ncbi:pseudouridine synthase deg1 [Glugoides intestinalis]
MKSTYFEYLNSLDKQQLINIIYQPFEQRGEYPGIAMRNIALRLSYHGENYKGVQHHKYLRTVHDCLQNALKLTGLGEEMVFCGRTDAGVSAISMIVSLKMKSRIENPNRSYKIVDSDYEEYPYDVILNSFLPEYIRLTGWAPVSDNFSARYDCIERHYRYFFVLNELDITKMEEATKEIIKMENFYKLSTHSNPKAKYNRKIKTLAIKKAHTEIKQDIGDEFQVSSKKDDVYYLEIRAHGFLHNMVRKIFWTIENCGKGKPLCLENIEIASPLPLVFVGAKFKEKLSFIGNKYSKPQFKDEKDLASVKAAMQKLRLERYEDAEL